MVGATGFEPATARPPDVLATGTCFTISLVQLNCNEKNAGASMLPLLH
jgi:hypothetical protein